VRQILARLDRRASRLRRDESGSSTVEFVMLFPLFMAIFFAAFESGYLMLRNVMLERSVDIAVRELRLGDPQPPTFTEFKQQICDQTYFIQNCDERIQVQLRPVNMTTWGPLNGDPRCIDVGWDETIDPFDQTEYLVGGNNELMMVRVCTLFRPLFPTTGLGLNMQYDGDGNYALVVTTAFVNEPSR
jgi:Flp pilus assembly protein TadG